MSLVNYVFVVKDGDYVFVVSHIGASMNASARVNIALGIRSQEFSDACGLPQLACRPADVVSSI